MSKAISQRDHLLSEFLKEEGYSDWMLNPIDGDASARRYFKLTKERQSYSLILMDYDPSEAPNEKALIYRQRARLAGTDMKSFAAIGTALYQRGFSAPKILAANTDTGFLILEDLSVDDKGSNIYARYIESHPEDELKLYEAAIDCLAAIYRSSFTSKLYSAFGNWEVGLYDRQPLMEELTLFTEWYVPDLGVILSEQAINCLLYTSPSPRDQRGSRMPSSA